MHFRYTAYKKYLYYLQHFATPKKLGNILKNRAEFNAGKTQLTSYPYKITFDPGNVCNLRCPGCHTGIKHHEMIKPAFMEPENYRRMFDKVKDYALSIALYNWGEPLLNKHIFEMIDYTRSQGVGTTMHSNFNHFNEGMAVNIVKSGLTHIYLSIDGATQEVYSRYRVKGNLENVIRNIEILTEVKKRMGSKLPFITWKFLKFPFNLHEVEEARAIAKKLGVDNFEVFNAVTQLTDIYDEAARFRNDPELLSTLKPKCKSLWSSIYIEPDGTVFPCSLSFRNKESFGNLSESDFMSVWNNGYYRAARSLFSAQPDWKNIPTPCNGCKFYLKCSGVVGDVEVLHS